MEIALIGLKQVYSKYDILHTKRGSSTRHIWWGSLDGRLSKKNFTWSGTLQRGARNDSEIGCQIFWVVLVSFLYITPILKKIGRYGLFHILGISILYKTVIKDLSISLIFIEVNPVFYKENGILSCMLLNKQP